MHILLLHLIFAAALNMVVSFAIGSWYPDRPQVPDLLFDTLPYIEWLQYLSDPVIIVSMAVFAGFLYSNRDKKLLRLTLLTLIITQYARALVIGLTPLGRFPDNSAQYGIFGVQQHGMFFSGHTAVAFALFLLIPATNKRLKYFFGICFALQVIILLLSRGHYSIDIVGGCMAAYIAWQVAEKQSIHADNRI